jgi:GntR family transcriptional regulator, transcriptional repressor for pyruvate dehydrogenase complex
MTLAYQPVRPRERLYQEIVDQIQAQVQTGRLSPGDRLPPERELAEQFGVSRTAVREAIKSLAEKGLVTVEVGRGTFVRAMTSEHVVESMALLLGDERGNLAALQVARELLEIPIARLAATNRTSANIERLSELLRFMEGAQADPQRFIDADTDFHIELARATGNPVLEVLSQTTVALMRTQRILLTEFEQELPAAVLSHRAILKAVTSRNARAAGEAMRSHLAHVSAVIGRPGGAPKRRSGASTRRR